MEKGARLEGHCGHGEEREHRRECGGSRHQCRDGPDTNLNFGLARCTMGTRVKLTTLPKQSVHTAQICADTQEWQFTWELRTRHSLRIKHSRVVSRVRQRIETGGKVSKQNDLKCRGDPYSLLSKMEHSQVGALSVKRDNEEVVSKRKELECAVIDDASSWHSWIHLEPPHPGFLISLPMHLRFSSSCTPTTSSLSTSSTSSSSRVCEQGVRARTPDLPHRWSGG